MWFRPAAEPFTRPVKYTERRMRHRPGVVLVAGFGGLLLIMAAAEAGTLLFLNSLRNNDASLQAHFLTRNRTLERIRSNIYLSGTFVQERSCGIRWSHPEQTGALAQMATLESLRRDSENALNNYGAELEPEEAVPLQDLRARNSSIDRRRQDQQRGSERAQSKSLHGRQSGGGSYLL